jgi:hypothetical protein
VPIAIYSALFLSRLKSKTQQSQRLKSLYECW